MSPYIWLALVIAFSLLEAMTTQMISIWLACGALFALIAALFGFDLQVQIVVFVLSTLVLLFATRPLVKKFIHVKKTPTNVDAVIGKTGFVILAIDNDKGEGQIKLQGIEWSARSENGMPIARETKVLVERIEGVKLFVSESAG